jgi:hypothetical protein
MIVSRSFWFSSGPRQSSSLLFVWGLLSAGLTVGTGVAIGPHRCAAQDDYPALGFSLPASSVSPRNPASARRIAAEPTAAAPTTRTSKLRGAQVAAAETAMVPTAKGPLPLVQNASHLHVEPATITTSPPLASTPTAAPQLPVSRSPAAAPMHPYVPSRETAIVPQPAAPPPDFTGSRPPVGTSPPGLWLVSQFLGEHPGSSAPPPVDLALPAPTPDEPVDTSPSSPLPHPHRLASHQQINLQQPGQPQPDTIPTPPAIEPVPTQEPLVAPAAPLTDGPAARVEIVTGSPPANSYQPVLWPTYLESRLLPSYPPECQPICRPCRPPLPPCCPCR